MITSWPIRNGRSPSNFINIFICHKLNPTRLRFASAGKVLPYSHTPILSFIFIVNSSHEILLSGFIVFADQLSFAGTIRSGQSGKESGETLSSVAAAGRRRQFPRRDRISQTGG